MARNYDEAVRKIRESGGIISSEDIKAAEKYNDQMALLEKRIKAASTKSGLLSWLNDVAKTLGDKGLFDFNRGSKPGDKGRGFLGTLLFGVPLEQLARQASSGGLLTGEGLGGSSAEQVAEAFGEKITKKMVDDARKTQEEKKVGKSIAEELAAGAEKMSGRKEEFRVDQLRRIGGGLGPGGTSGPDPVTDAVAYWLPLVLSAAQDINRKTPPINDGGRY